jgi:hypothetical protein
MPSGVVEVTQSERVGKGRLYNKRSGDAPFSNVFAHSVFDYGRVALREGEQVHTKPEAAKQNCRDPRLGPVLVYAGEVSRSAFVFLLRVGSDASV